MKKPTDKQRIDWLEKNHVNLIAPMEEFKTWALTSDDYEWINKIKSRPTARRAIDAAMAEEARRSK